MKRIKNKKAQSVTEFVMVLPVLIMLLAGLCQLSSIMITRIELAMVEREVMRYLTADAEDKETEKVEAFIMEYAGKIGLDKDKISYKPKGRLFNADKSMDKMGLLENVSGITINLEYEEELMRVFALMTGRETLVLKTSLATAAGSCMKFKIKEKAEEIWGKITGGGPG